MRRCCGGLFSAQPGVLISRMEKPKKKKTFGSGGGGTTTTTTTGKEGFSFKKKVQLCSGAGRSNNSWQVAEGGGKKELSLMLR